MEPQTELINLVIDTIEKSPELDAAVKMDALPPYGGVYAEILPGQVKEVYLNKKAVRILPLLLISKGKDQQEAYEILCRIGNYLEKLPQYPDGEQAEWLRAEMEKEPAKYAKQDDGQFLYSCTVNLTVCY